MRVPNSISDNLKFLLIEVSAQVSDLRAALETASAELAQGVLDRSGYADNLKIRIHECCIDTIRQSNKASASPHSLRVMESIASDITRIAKLCRDCVRKFETLDDRSRARGRKQAVLLWRVEKGLKLVGKALDNRSTENALKITQVKTRIDREYKWLLKSYSSELKKKKVNPEAIISAIIIAQRIEEMGGALMAIGDAIISANLGQSLSTDRFKSLSSMLEVLKGDGKTRDMTIEPLAQTRSGGAISGIGNGNDKDGYLAVFKDGKHSKLKQERDMVDRWNKISPGLAPKILSFAKQDDSATLLIEHLPGQTFEQVLRYEKRALLVDALNCLKKILHREWRKTRREKVVPAEHMRQLSKRLDNVYDIHPEFRNDGANISGAAIASFGSLVSACAVREAKLTPPFSVHIHGDFNIDNIIYDKGPRRIRFIDLHRSQYMDYVQDVSVFMVSNSRLQTLDSEHCQRVEWVVLDFYRFASDFAAETGDDTYQIRLALGLARSFATSTRFIMDKSLAKKMFIKSRYLMERVLESNPGKPQRFNLPIEDLFIG